MPNRRILFIVPSLRRAGAEVQVVQLVNGLATEKFDKFLISYLPDNDLVEQVEANEVTYFHLNRRKKIDFSVAKEIAGVIDEHNIDVIHCTLQNALLYGWWARHLASRSPALICAIHTTRNPSWKHVLADRLIYRRMLMSCDQVWFMCRNQASMWIKRMPFLKERYHVIYNGVDLEKFVSERFVDAGLDLREATGIPANAKVVCAVAGFRPEKLHAVLLRSFRKVARSSREECYLLLAGAGPMEDNLKDLVEELGLAQRVKFLGELSDVRPLLAAANCKALVSEAETFSMAMLEAMAMGVPVLATRVGGSCEAIEDGVSGVLVSPGDVCELAEKMSSLLENQSRLKDMGQQANKTVVERFSYQKMIATSSRLLMSIRIDT
jgi:glycosyltransferase involved in cell wall biosynthesis